ncbi:MAG: shikimate kinase [Myxococcota bacterium]
MDDPYYSYAPTVVMARPLALAGFMGARVPLTGALLSAQTGLPFIDLDRHVEHDAGRSLVQLVHDRGAEAVAAHERRVLGRVLREQPPPIIALGHGTLTDPRTAAMLGAAQIVFIRRPLDELFVQLTADIAEQGLGRFWPLAHRRPESAAALAELYGPHSGGYERAAWIIEASGQHPQRVARIVLDYLASSSGSITTAVP